MEVNEVHETPGDVALPGEGWVEGAPAGAPANGSPKPPRESKAKIKHRDGAPREAAGDGEPRRSSVGRGGGAAFRAMASDQQKSLRDIIDGLGSAAGAYRIAIKRLSPDSVEDPTQPGKMIQVKGHVATLESEPITEEEIAKKFGGGKYELIFTIKNAAGSFEYLTGGHKVLDIAGDPILTALPRLRSYQAPAPLAPPPAQAENSAVVNHAISALARQNEQLFDRMDQHQKPTGPDPALTAMMSMMETTIARQSAEMTEMRRMLNEAQTKAATPIQDPVKDRWMDKLIDGDSARIEALRTRHESEIRQLRDHALETEKRLRDEQDRDRRDTERRHEMSMQMVKQQYENLISTMKQSHDLALAAATSAYSTQKEIANAENKRLERDNSEMRVEVKDLRAKKEKTTLELIKDYKQLEDVFDSGESEPKGAIATLAEAIGNPEVWRVIPEIFAKRDAAQVAPPPQQPQLPARPQIFRDPQGKFWTVENGQMVPVKKKKVVKTKKPRAAAPPVAPADGEQTETAAADDLSDLEASMPGADAGQPAVPPEPEVEDEETEEEMPELEPEQRALLVGVLESAVGKQPPEVVAQMLRSRMPEPAIIWLGDKVSELGLAKAVNIFLTQIAEVKQGSPLLTQDGRNWVRQMTRDLLGDSSA